MKKFSELLEAKQPAWKSASNSDLNSLRKKYYDFSDSLTELMDVIGETTEFGEMLNDFSAVEKEFEKFDKKHQLGKIL